MGSPFSPTTNPSTGYQKIDNPSGRLARWGHELYNFTVQYHQGEQNLMADALSRR